MPKKFTFVTITFAILATLTFGAVAKAETPTDQKASPTPTAKPQNTIPNTSKERTKDIEAPPTSPAPSPKSPKELKADKGWDGKVQGKKQASPTATPTPAKSR
jgi:hypothetical protein